MRAWPRSNIQLIESNIYLYEQVANLSVSKDELSLHLSNLAENVYDTTPLNTGFTIVEMIKT